MPRCHTWATPAAEGPGVCRPPGCRGPLRLVMESGVVLLGLGKVDGQNSNVDRKPGWWFQLT